MDILVFFNVWVRDKEQLGDAWVSPKRSKVGPMIGILKLMEIQQYQV